MTAAGSHLLQPRTRLLVVEDEFSTVFALREFFALAGYDVDCASGPYEGLLLLDRNLYDAVITDLHLTPGRRGEGLNIVAHARQRNPYACVVMLTAYGSEATEREAYRRGVNLYQTKPVDLRRLTGDIERVRDGDDAPPALGRTKHETRVAGGVDDADGAGGRDCRPDPGAHRAGHR